MSNNPSFCSVCDHNVLPGVACDGQPEECPYHVEHPAKPVAQNSYAVITDSMTGIHDSDAVKGVD